MRPSQEEIFEIVREANDNEPGKRFIWVDNFTGLMQVDGEPGPVE